MAPAPTDPRFDPKPSGPSPDGDAWIDALESGETPAITEPGLDLHLLDLVKRSGYEIAAVRHGWRIVVPLPDGRKQSVYAGHAGTDSDKRPILGLISICGPANDRDPRRLLKFNASMADGHFAIKVLRGEEYFVVVDNFPAESVPSLDVQKTVRHIAETADGLERRLTGGLDVY